jgi:hypothetical protein
VAGTSKQFMATVTGIANQDVVWSLESTGTIVGSISDTGLYWVPTSFTGTALIIVKAASLANPTQPGTATVSVLPATPLGPVVSQQVSVAIAQTPGQAGPFIAPQVSVEIEQASTTSGIFVSPLVSVELEPATTPSGPFVTPQVSVALTPIISAIAPNSGAQGVVNLLITITGTGLSGTTSLSFLLNGTADMSMTASNITANAQGTQVTAELTIDSAAPTGLRVVRITTPNGTSPVAATEGNTFTVTVP